MGFYRPMNLTAAKISQETAKDCTQTRYDLVHTKRQAIKGLSPGKKTLLPFSLNYLTDVEWTYTDTGFVSHKSR